VNRSIRCSASETRPFYDGVGTIKPVASFDATKFGPHAGASDPAGRAAAKGHAKWISNHGRRCVAQGLTWFALISRGPRSRFAQAAYIPLSEMYRFFG
jgi:hypothetical protein